MLSKDLKKEIKKSLLPSSLNIFKDMYSHDMRSIFSKVLMSAELGEIYLDKPENSEKMLDLLEIIGEQVNRGRELISSIQNLNKIDTKLLLVRPINLKGVLEDVISHIKKSNQISNLSIKIKHLKSNIVVHANDLLKDVFENILINAINYNNKSYMEIQVNISKHIDMKLGNCIKIEFLDNGIGIPNSRKETIFYRYDENKGGKGMGLGLSLVKQVMEIFDGKIWVEDRIEGDHEQGSKFVLLIPEICD